MGQASLLVIHSQAEELYKNLLVDCPQWEGALCSDDIVSRHRRSATMPASTPVRLKWGITPCKF